MDLLLIYEASRPVAAGLLVVLLLFWSEPRGTR